ncbi:hypothetical protein EYF80_059999 [Liparis tanakae]|uniref:Uncharacterized protein n=1 Tax=Liparis tanakae TaxID=230148 RepID=A0A4Z2ELX4_9TELE|nr:hypothetical protein EYF80_059999 [Liparis tanakae]
MSSSLPSLDGRFPRLEDAMRLQRLKELTLNTDPEQQTHMWGWTSEAMRMQLSRETVNSWYRTQLGGLGHGRRHR